MKKSDVIKFAEEQGYKSVEYIGKWNGFDCYEPILIDDDSEEPTLTGLPLLILVKDNEIRMSTPEEAMKQLADA